jgi:hypothetical protein
MTGSKMHSATRDSHKELAWKIKQILPFLG